jgi:lysophospholipase L1-like esterase
VMLGDSLTEGAQWAEITGCAFLANRGIGGDDTAGLLRRLDGVTSLKPAAVFLMIGVNDVNSGVSTDTIVDHVGETIEKLTKSGARVYLTLVLPVAESFKKINLKIDELNKAYLKLAKETKVTVVDFRADTRNADGFLKDEFSRDGIHLTAEGYRVWRDAVVPLVQRHCAAREAPAPQVMAPKPSRTNSVPTVSETPASSTPATAPSGEFNTRFGPWR